jgi:hypothetical protein
MARQRRQFSTTKQTKITKRPALFLGDLGLLGGESWSLKAQARRSRTSPNENAAGPWDRRR